MSGSPSSVVVILFGDSALTDVRTLIARAPLWAADENARVLIVCAESAAPAVDLGSDVTVVTVPDAAAANLAVQRSAALGRTKADVLRFVAAAELRAAPPAGTDWTERLRALDVKRPRS